MTNKRKKNTKNVSLSSQNIVQDKKQKAMTEEEIKILNDKVFSAVNDLELQKSLDKWLKDHAFTSQVVRRDLSILKNNLCEYMDTFLVLGYTMEGERVIMQNFKTCRDRDAIVEFLKTVFLKQQHENFLDE